MYNDFVRGVDATRAQQRASRAGVRRRCVVHGRHHARSGHILADYLEIDGHIYTARAQDVEHRRVRNHRVFRSVRVHTGPTPAQELPEAQEAYGHVLRRIPVLHGRVRILVRKLMARHLGRHGHGDGHPAVRSRRYHGAGYMQLGLHEDAAQHCRSAHSHTHRQL